MRKRANYKKTQTRRTAVEVLFFALFIALISAGAVQLWLAVFAVSVLLGLRWARLYCGWVCPINTAFRPLRWVYAKLGVRRPMPGAWLQQKWLRYGALAAFVAAAVGQQLLGVTLPILAAVTVVAVLLTLVFDEQWWHATLCPFGTVLHHSSRAAKRSMAIDADTCIGCGKCDAVCPTDAIFHHNADGSKKPLRGIAARRCLVCFRCAEVCPVNAVWYGATGITGTSGEATVAGEANV